jgi:eukaryotic-like serine/threonine-protein kinase
MTATLTVACAVCLLAVSVIAQLDAGAAWPASGFDARQSRQSTWNGPTTGVNMLWSASIGINMVAAPAIGRDDAIIIGSASSVSAFNGSTGAVIWSAPISGVVSATPAITADGLVVVGCASGDVSAFNGTGAVKWTFSTSGRVGSAAVATAAGVFIGSDDHALYLLDQRTGARIWRSETGGPIGSSSPAVSPDGRAVFIASQDTKLWAIDVASGEALWTAGTGGQPAEGSPAVSADGASVFVGSNDNCVRAFDTSDGALLWKTCTGGSVEASPALSLSAALDSESETQQAVVVGSLDGAVYAFNASDGTLLWRYDTGNPVTASAALGANGVAYIGTGGSSHSLLALDVRTGEALWETTVWEYFPAIGSPALSAAGALLVASSTDGGLGTLYAFATL